MTSSEHLEEERPPAPTGQLRKERDILAAAVEIAGTLIAVLDRLGRIIYYNHACELLTGFSRKEVKGKHIWELLVPLDEVHQVKSAFAELESGQFPREYEGHWIARDGSRLLISWTNKALVNEAGEVEYVISTGLDITEKQQYQEELQQRSRELGERNKELNCLFGISRLRDRKELSTGELLQCVVDLIPQSWQHPEIACARIVCEGKTYATEDFCETRWKLAATIVADNETVGIVEVCYLKKRPKHDEGPFLAEERSLIRAVAERLGRIVEHDRGQIKIQEYQRKLRRLASELSLTEERQRRRIAVDLHDGIGQALAVARFKLAGLQKSTPQVAVEEILEILDEAIHEARTLIFELSPPVLHELGFEAAVAWLADSIQEETGLVIRFTGDENAEPLEEDVSIVLFQVVRELLHNVIKHARARTVDISVRTSDDSVEVIVEDDGQGFDTSALSSGSGKEQGFGLFSIRERLLVLSGDFSVESARGEGTKATLRVPISGQEQSHAAIPIGELAAPQGDKIRVLLADDHKITREGLHSLLGQYQDIEVVAGAAGGQEALALARELMPDVVVMDVAMPDLSGVQATQKLVNELPGMKVLALSMHSDARFVLEMLKSGAAGYLLKDCAQEDLAQAIRAVHADLTFLSPRITNTVVQDYLEHQASTASRAADTLTPREREVLKALAEGFSSKQIAARIQTSVKTVETHRQHIMAKLDMHSVAALTKYAVREGLADLDA